MTDMLTAGPQLDRPLFLRQVSTDEYDPQPYSSRDELVVARTIDRLERVADHRQRTVAQLASTRAGTAAGLRELNAEWGEQFYDVPDDAVRNEDAAVATFDGPELVIDVQTHFMAPHCMESFPVEMLVDLNRANMPAWWTEMDDVLAYDLTTFIRKVFLECETAVAVLTSGPGVDNWRNLFNDEMAATRALVDGFAGTGRLLNHTLVHPNLDKELESMEEFAELYRPAGWKVYTMGVLSPEGPVMGWRLDDEENGHRFLEKARNLGVNLVCCHKGISWLVDNGSPADLGPAATAFPELSFLAYHSGYEMPSYSNIEEGPFTDATADIGVNRLISSVREAGLGTGANVYAELGTTWFSLIRRPVEAAHVLGKLITNLGEDNVVWGTDSIWYGSAQPVIDAFRAFQIPDRMCEEFGYQKLTPEVKNKILSGTAARLYGIDVPTMRERVKNDDLAWARALLADVEANGFAGLR